MKSVKENLRSYAGLIALLVLLCLLCGCSDLPGSEDLPKDLSPSAVPSGTLTPSLTPTPSAEAPSVSPTPAPTATPVPATPTPTPLPDISGVKDGGYNACAKWRENSYLDSPAPVKLGMPVYINNFERDLGNRLAHGNSGNEAEVFATDKVSATGYFCCKVTRRKQDYHGLSGLGFRLDSTNGLSYDSLVGHTLQLHFRLYYEDEGFGVADTLNLTLFDAYQTEVVLDYVYNPRDGSIMTDSAGNPVKERKERPVAADTVVVKRGDWQECTLYVAVKATSNKDGCLILGTLDEQPNSVGLYCSYYIDDLIITVVDPAQAPERVYPDYTDRISSWSTISGVDIVPRPTIIEEEPDPQDKGDAED